MKTKLTPELSDKILERLQEGKTLKDAVKGLGVTPGTVSDWASNPANPEQKEFAIKYKDSRFTASHIIADQALDLSKKATDKNNANAIKVRLDAMWRWCAAMNPEQYGQRNRTEVTGKAGKDLVINIVKYGEKGKE